jgi:hypothetical protein
MQDALHCWQASALECRKTTRLLCKLALKDALQLLNDMLAT